jgi:uncharacterized membrane protein
MWVLVSGLMLFLGSHAVSMARGMRTRLIERLGEGGFKGAYTALSLMGLVLIVYGFSLYRSASWINVWYPPVWSKHLALLLTLPIFILLAATNSKGRIHAAVKHPMLLAVKIWATAHLIANGDLGSILLFGSFLAWAVIARISLKRRPGVTVPPRPPGFTQRDWIAIVVGLGLWVVFALWLHPLLIGVTVWPGR